ncbi:MAG: outer membrane beta-barrel protein [Myxococcota bacterium]
MLADGDEDPRIEAMEQRLLALEDRLNASEDVIAAQRDLLKAQATPAVSQGGGLDSFLSGLEVGGHVTTSYLYNFNSPRSGPSGAQPLCQFNCNSNEFSLDAAKLEIGKAATNPGDAGFQLDLLFGQNADISRFLSPTHGPLAGGVGVNVDDDFSLFVQQAYVSYNYNGVELKMGNFETLLGWELIDSHKNYNVTHGILFTWTIPLYHTGLMAGGSLGENVGWNLGFVNGFNNTVERNDSKGVLGLISLDEGPFFASLSAYYGADAFQGTAGQPGSSDDQLILDLVATYTPNDDLTFWLNVDYGEQEDGDPTGGDADWWGIAVGTNVTINDKLSFALRGEYFEDDDNVRGIANAARDFEAYSLTGTLAYKLTDHLTVRTELRYDKADDDRIGGGDGEIFPDDSSSGFEDDALYGIVEVSYVFD